MRLHFDWDQSCISQLSFVMFVLVEYCGVIALLESFVFAASESMWITARFIALSPDMLSII